MPSVRSLVLGALLLAVAGCQDDPLKSQLPSEPTPPAEGVQAFLQVDNPQAKPGDVVHVYVKVQLGTQSDVKVGSYTGRLAFDPASLEWKNDVQLDDGLRVTNPNGASKGEIRFAGASATGLANLTLYEGAFQVKNADYMDKLVLKMEELSAAASLKNLQPSLQVAPQIFLRVEGR